MNCPVCTPEKITQLHAPMTTIVLGGKPYLKCNSCGAQIPVVVEVGAGEQKAPPHPAEAENAALKQRVAELEAEQSKMADQGAALMGQIEELKATPAPAPAPEPPVTPQELPPAPSSVGEDPTKLE